MAFKLTSPATASASKGRPRELRYASKKRRTVVHRTANAAACIGPLSPGLAISGLTAGQFSQIDALEHMLDELGPADVRISSWTTGVYDVTRAAKLKVEEHIKSIRLLLDRGTFEKSPTYAAPLIERLGVEAFRCLAVHAKVIIVEGDRGCAVMRGSGNFNKTLRTEQFDLDCDPALVEFYRRWFDALWDQSGRSQDNKAIMEAVYDRYLAGEGDKETVDSRKAKFLAAKDVAVDIGGLI